MPKPADSKKTIDNFPPTHTPLPGVVMSSAEHYTEEAAFGDCSSLAGPAEPEKDAMECALPWQ